MRRFVLFFSLFVAIYAVASEVTVARSTGAIADQCGWQHDAKPGSFVLNNAISITNEKPNDQCKYDANNDGGAMRFYQQCGYFTIQGREGVMIKTIKLTYNAFSSGNQTKYGVLTKDFGTNGYNIAAPNLVESGKEYAVNANSIKLWIGSSAAYAEGNANRGALRIISWEVVYEDSLSVVEGYSALNKESSTSDVKFKGDRGLYTWKAKNFQHKASTDNGDYINGVLGIRIKYNSTTSEGYLAMDGAQEGGIKAISFDYHTTGNEMPVHFLIKEGGNTLDNVQLKAPAKTSHVYNYNKELNLESNTAISIVNPKQESPQQTFFVMGPIVITPYLLFNVAGRQEVLELKDSGSYDLNKVLINNTGAEPVFTITRNTSDATVEIVNGVLSISGMTQSGEIGIQAAWNSVTTTMSLQVGAKPEPSEGEVWTETFSNCSVTKLYDGREHVMGDAGIYDWSIARFQRVASEDTIAGAQGIRVRYDGQIATAGVQEGGVKELSFDWRATGKDMPVHFIVRVDGKDYPVELAGVATTDVKTYWQGCQVKHNTSWSVSVPSEESPAQTYVVVGPIKIMPYLLFKAPNHRDTLQIAETTSYDLKPMLIDNTQGVGEITYAIVSDATGVATISGSVVTLGEVKESGAVAVEAAWGDVTTTMTLWVEAVPETGMKEVQNAQCTMHSYKMMKDGQLRIWRGGECFSVLGNTIK